MDKNKETPESSVCFNASLHPRPTPHPPAPSRTESLSPASVGGPACARAAGSWARWRGVLGVCRLTRAQAAICHPALASLILFLGPGRGQQARCLILTKRLPAAGGQRQEKLWELWSAAPRQGPLTRCLARGGRRPRQTAPCLLSPPPLFYQPHRPQGLMGRQRRGRRERETRRGEGGGQMNTMEGLTRSTLTPPSIHLWGKDLSIPYGQAAALSSFPLHDPSRPFPLSNHSRAPRVCAGRARPCWPSPLHLYRMCFRCLKATSLRARVGPGRAVY